MAIALTPTVTAYRITPSSPTGELLTLARIYDDIGDYASTILDTAHRALTRLCRRRSAAVTRELRRRSASPMQNAECIMHNDAGSTEADCSAAPLTGEATSPSPIVAQAVPAAHHGTEVSNLSPIDPSPLLTTPSSLITDPASLSSMSISDLYTHYLAWPQRHEALIDAGHEPLDFNYEARIIRELQRRTAANLDEQLKIDYCLLTYRSELLNLSHIHSFPLEAMHNEEFIIHN